MNTCFRGNNGGVKVACQRFCCNPVRTIYCFLQPLLVGHICEVSGGVGLLDDSCCIFSKAGEVDESGAASVLRQEQSVVDRLVDSPSSQKHTSPVAGSEIDDSPFRLVLKVHRLPDYFRVKVPVAA